MPNTSEDKVEVFFYFDPTDNILKVLRYRENVVYKAILRLGCDGSHP